MASQTEENVPKKLDESLGLFLYLSKIKERLRWVFGSKETFVTKLF